MEKQDIKIQKQKRKQQGLVKGGMTQCEQNKIETTKKQENDGWIV